MKIRSLLAVTLISAAALLPPFASAQVAISPPLANISLNTPAKPHAFRLMNDSHDPMRVAVTVVNWSMDEHGKIGTIPPTEQSLAPWIQINPTQFTIAPGQSQVVRYAIRPAVPLAPGEHRAMVFFTQQPTAADTAKSASLHVYFRLGAAIYGHMGPVHASGKVARLTSDAHDATFVLHNTGNATTRMLGQYALWTRAAWPGAGKAIDIAQLRQRFHAAAGLLQYGRLPKDAVLPGTRRIVVLPFSKPGLPPGRYVLQVSGKLGDRVIQRTLSFDVARARH
ncbi:MAG: hypothetical protein ACREPY_16090 [Rhodanobacteraceae bacterium]